MNETLDGLDIDEWRTSCEELEEENQNLKDALKEIEGQLHDAGTSIETCKEKILNLSLFEWY